MTLLVVGRPAQLEIIKDDLQDVRCLVVQTLADAHKASGLLFDNLLVLRGVPAEAERYLRGLVRRAS